MTGDLCRPELTPELANDNHRADGHDSGLEERCIEFR